MDTHQGRLTPEELLSHADWLRQLARTMSGGGDPEDLVQATYLTALRKPPRPEMSAKRWLAEVLRNALRMRVRAEHRRARREAAYVVMAYPDGEPSSEALFTEAQDEASLHQRISALPEPYRTTVRLRYEEGLSSAEIARREGLPSATVRWRLMVGLDKLRENVAKAGKAAAKPISRSSFPRAA